MLMTVYSQAEQFASNCLVIVSIVPGLGRMSDPPTISVLAVPPESAMIQSAAAVPATLNGAVTVAVTFSQPSQSGGMGLASSWKWLTTTGMPASLAAWSCGPRARGSGAPLRTIISRRS
jgi:hypothetical protein